MNTFANSELVSLGTASTTTKGTGNKNAEVGVGCKVNGTHHSALCG
jgi:hypothetical protein